MLNEPFAGYELKQMITNHCTKLRSHWQKLTDLDAEANHCLKDAEAQKKEKPKKRKERKR